VKDEERERERFYPVANRIIVLINCQLEFASSLIVSSQSLSPLLHLESQPIAEWESRMEHTI
jgi:hypothetical protein